MNRCLQLAANGKQTCSPNPMVGAVIVHQGRIIGEGWHRKSGEPHAEPNAIHSVRNPELLSLSTLYVSLEPCSHYGKTPPCVDIIIQHKIPRVVIGMLDPFPLVSGRGVAILKDAGVEVLIGVQEEACRKLNQSYLNYLTKRRPWIILKWAQTADGFIDSIRSVDEEKPSMKISTPFTQMLTHKLRSECDAILVGTNTALLDNPSLNVRYWSGKNPLRLVIDRRGLIPSSSRLFDGSVNTIVYTSVKSDNVGAITWVKLDFEQDVLTQIMEDLYLRKIQSLLVEGGTFMHQTFLQANLWDEIQVETSVQQVGSGVYAPKINNLPTRICGFQEYAAATSYREIKTLMNTR